MAKVRKAKREETLINPENGIWGDIIRLEHHFNINYDTERKICLARVRINSGGGRVLQKLLDDIGNEVLDTVLRPVSGWSSYYQVYNNLYGVCKKVALSRFYFIERQYYDVERYGFTLKRK